MYINLGNNTVLRKKKIVGVFDMDTATVAQISREFLRKSEKENNTVITGYEIPKSFVVCDDGKTYYSQLSPQTLSGRIESKKI